jgi:3-methyl-2-oxobutanoate hydroxymethyltransferase
VLVLHDVLGLSERTFKFAKSFAHLRQEVIDATSGFVTDVQAGVWPDDAHSFH